jgi:hypothetical protein
VGSHQVGHVAAEVGREEAEGVGPLAFQQAKQGSFGGALERGHGARGALGPDIGKVRGPLVPQQCECLLKSGPPGQQVL